VYRSLVIQDSREEKRGVTSLVINEGPRHLDLNYGGFSFWLSEIFYVLAFSRFSMPSSLLTVGYQVVEDIGIIRWMLKERRLAMFTLG
jgi:hypothetical protein